MLFLKLITKDGYPVKYSLSKEILNGISEKKAIAENDKNQLKVSILIESKSNDKGELRKAMDQISENLKKDEQYVVYSLNIAEIVLHEDLFSTFISAELSCSSISSLFRLIYYYGATSVEVLKPDKYPVSLFDLQQASHIITEMTHGYAQMIYQLKQENAELSKLRK
jgi:predicted RND superfamily exporter protein